MFNCSTTWNALKHSGGEEIVEEIKNLGLTGIELGFSLSQKKVEEILSACLKHSLQIESVHNFCPVPDGYAAEEFMPDHFSLASLDEQQRKRAIDLTSNSLKLAKKANAKALIIHAGRVEMQAYSKELIRLLADGQKDTPAYRTIMLGMLEERNEKKAAHMKAVKTSLKELLALANKLQIVLCLENRYYPREIPSLAEIGELFDEFSKYSNFGYWHDVGHAQVNENLGLEKHLNYLEKYANRLVGMHLHDVKEAQDHLVPGKGDFNFSILKPYLKKNTIMVLEIHQPATADDLKAGISYLSKSEIDVS